MRKGARMPSDRFRAVLRHEKKPEGYTSTPTGLKRLKTQNTAFRINENGKGTPSGVPQPIHKRKLILVKEEFDASSFGGAGGSRTRDLFVADETLYQLSYGSIAGINPLRLGIPLEPTPPLTRARQRDFTYLLRLSMAYWASSGVNFSPYEDTSWS